MQSTYTEHFRELFTELKKYLGLQKKYVTLEAADKLTVILSTATLVAICLILGAMVLFFATFALAYFIGQLAHSIALGFLCIAVLLLIALWIVYAHRVKWIVQPFALFMANLFVNKEDEDE